MELMSYIRLIKCNSLNRSKILNKVVLTYERLNLYSSSSIVPTSKLESDLCQNAKEIISYENNKVFQPKFQLPPYNIAAYLKKSNTLQELAKLGVNLYKIEKTKGAPDVILRLDFERDIKKYIQFLHDLGVSVDRFGELISKNPFLFKEDIENLWIRINYLKSKHFSQEDICRIVVKNPPLLSFHAKDIDSRLGYFQGKFRLEGSDVRLLTVKMPKIITYDLDHIEKSYFSIKEELGFTTEEIKALVLRKPKIFTLSRHHLIERFCYLHTTLGLDHKQLVTQPGILLCRLSRVRERHEFLKHLDRAQYDCDKPGYISPISLVSFSDSEFCSQICKVSTTTYNKFLKTLC